MARDFNGTAEEISFGSDASLDAFSSKTLAFWLECDDTGVNEGIVTKFDGSAGWFLFQGSGNDVAFGQLWSGAPGLFWDTTTTVTGRLVHVVCSYNSSDVANNAVITLDGVDDTVTENGGPPSGSPTSDAAANLVLGDGTSIGVSDFDGRIQNLVYTNSIWDASQKNRHRWYGTPGGAVVLRHPMITTKLTNEGTGTGNGSATGTVVASLPRTERCYGASMGCGR